MTHEEIAGALRQPVGGLREHIPALFKGYGALSGAVFGDGALGTVHSPRAFEAFHEVAIK
jgi:hypothetical protein